MAASFIRTAENVLSCPICFELFVDPNTPKILPGCGHVCCEICLKKIAAGKCAKSCPECRKIVSIPTDGVTSFLTNFRLRDLAEDHQKIPDGQIASDRQIATPTVSTCPDHDSEKMHYYCTICNMLACQACLILKHNGSRHTIVGVKEKYSHQRAEMKSIVEKTQHAIHTAEDKKQNIQTQVNQERTSRAAVDKQIDDCVEEHMNKLLEESQRLKIQVQQASEQKITNLQQKMSVLDGRIQSAERKCCEASNALETRPDYEYVTQHASLADQVNRLDLEGPQITPTEFPPAVFEKAIVPDMPLGRFIAGLPCRLRKLKQIQTLDGFELARTVGSSANGLLTAVCDFRGKKVIIYHRLSNGQYEKSREVNLTSSNIYEPRDVVICSDGRLLVARGTCIEVYTPEGNYLKNINTTDKPGTNVNVHSVVIRSNGNILAGDIARSIITEHDPTDNIVRTMKTKIRPLYISLVHDTHIAMTDLKTGKVSVMDMKSGQETLSIDIPEVAGICYDEATDCLLTVRSEPFNNKPGYVLYNTGVIEQYSLTTGRLLAQLAHGLYYSHGLGLLSDGHLAVADKKTVKIYQIE